MGKAASKTAKPKAKAKRAPPKERKPLGRPSSRTPALCATICERIAHGNSLRSICRDEAMPALSTVFKWLADSEEFSDQYARAREAQADALFDEILEIADEEVTMVKRSKHQAGASADDDTEENEVEVVFDPTAVQRNKLRVDARKWMAGKLRPKVYGDRQEINLTAQVEIASSIMEARKRARPAP